MPIGESSNWELYAVAKDGTKWSMLGTVTDMEIRRAPDEFPTAKITTILHKPIKFSAALDTEEPWRTFACLAGIYSMNKKEETHMKISEKMALRLHLMMWGDMQKELGDNPDGDERIDYKRAWVKENFPGLDVDSNCWLCEYTIEDTGHRDCDHCPIVWGASNSALGICSCNLRNNVSYLRSPISEILALPARNPELQYVVDDFNRARKKPGFHDGYMSCLTDIWNAAGCIGEKFKGAPDVYKDYVHIDAFNGMKEKLSKASGLNVNDPIVEHVEAIRTQAYNKGVEDVIGKLDEAYQNGMNATMEKILKGEIQSDTSKKLEQKGYNKACEDICKEAGVQTSYTTYGLVARIKEVGWSECKKHIISHCNITGADYKDFTSDILTQYKNQVIEEYKKEQPAPFPSYVSVDIDKAFKDYAAEQMKSLRKQYILDTHALAQESGLDSDRPVDDHIREIVKNSMEAGAANERERIMEKIEEMLDE